MTSATIKKSDLNAPFPHAERIRKATRGKEATVLTNIYKEQTDIAIWQRQLTEDIEVSASEILASKLDLEFCRRVTPQNAEACIAGSLCISGVEEFSYDVAQLVDMFCCLFARPDAGLRLIVLTRAMCPRFHVDNVPCRMVTTYQGPATEWLPHQSVDRSRLGTGNQGKPDGESGVYSRSGDIQQMAAGDVALLKGELWEGNENAGLVHRSPAVPAGRSRLFLTLDVLH
ncbi:MAG: DUF1826 domain-containing protein [Halioglobus sp.]|nr:DUF1826 domain-containing protein [Halioglobus sp.]